MEGYQYTHGDRPLDGYTIHYALGRGGFGEVYFAVSDAGREVALKAVQNYEEIEMRGISSCMNLKSPHLVTIFDVKQDAQNRPWVIMEYVSGPSMREVLDEAIDSSGRPRGIGEDQAMYFMRELIKGMRYLHDAGVVHRDLKPHNIFFEDGTVKIGDYSLSKAISTSHRSSHTTTVGSVHYMAPEIGEGKYGKAVDIYALGVILFEMLTGAPPYVGESMGEVLIKHLTSEPDVSGISAPYAATIGKAMARKPEDRFQSVDQMLRALCPQDHSSYLPPPASLSMIGERAVRQRAKPVAAVLEKPPQSPASDSGIVETRSVYGALEDTREEFDSQPFERPGIAMPPVTRSLLNYLGLLWKRSDMPVSGSDPVPLGWRMAVAAIVSALFVAGLAIIAPPPSPLAFCIMLGTVPLIGGLLCWAFLQTLPRNDAITWSMVASVVAAIIITPVCMLWMALLDELNVADWDDDFIPALFIFSLMIDWRCFISADRYPRVGLLRTFVASGLLMTALFVADERNSNVFSAGVLGSAVIVTIQILAPLARVGPAASKQRVSQIRQKSAMPGPRDSDEIQETRTDTDSFLLQENK